MAPKLEPRGGPTNQLFAHWTLLGDTLPPKGTPLCPRGGPGRPNGGQGAPKWSQNGAKIEPKGSQMERKWSCKRAPSEPNVIYFFYHIIYKCKAVLVEQFTGESPCKQCFQQGSYTLSMTPKSKIFWNLWPRLGNNLEE